MNQATSIYGVPEVKEPPTKLILTTANRELSTPRRDINEHAAQLNYADGLKRENIQEDTNT